MEPLAFKLLRRSAKQNSHQLHADVRIESAEQAHPFYGTIYCMVAPVNESSRKLSLFTPTRSGFRNQGSKTKIGYSCAAPWMAARRAGLSCSLRPFLNHSRERWGGGGGMQLPALTQQHASRIRARGCACLKRDSRLN